MIQPNGGPVVIADYGSSEGRNSLAALSGAVDDLQARTDGWPPDGPRPVAVVDTDQPGNDFCTLFEVMADDPGSYRRSGVLPQGDSSSADVVGMPAVPARLTHIMGYTDAPEGWWQEFVGADPPPTGKLAVVRADGSPHVAPVWVDLDGDDVIFMTSAESVKGKAILRDQRVALCFDDEQPPFAFVTIRGTASTSTDPDELLRWGTRIGGRYMGDEQAEAYGRRNAVPPEMLVRVTVDRVVAKVHVAD